MSRRLCARTLRISWRTWSPLQFRSMSCASTPPRQALVRCPQDGENLTITLPLAGRVRNLDRPKSEALQKALTRLRSNAMPKKEKQGKKGTKQPADAPHPDVHVSLHTGSSIDSAVVEDNVTNQQAWQHGRLLVVGSEHYIIDHNPPIVDKVEIPCMSMIGIPICPLPAMSFCDSDLTAWQWLRSQPLDDTADKDQRVQKDSTDSYSIIEGAVERVYTPAEADEGCTLMVQCTPKSRSEDGRSRAGNPCSAATGPVCKGPALTAGARRHPLTAAPLKAPAFRVITYNILADQYASREHSQTVLFSYCPKRFLDPDYRRPLILQELLGFHADIICLQEVDEKAFAEYFLPQLQHAGFEGHYTNKSSGTREGEATFYRCSRFQLSRKLDLSLRDCFKDILNGFQETSAHQSQQGTAQRAQRAARHAHFKPVLQSSPHLSQVLLHVATVAQITLLDPVPDQTSQNHIDAQQRSHSGDPAVQSGSALASPAQPSQLQDHQQSPAELCSHNQPTGQQQQLPGQCQEPHQEAGSVQQQPPTQLQHQSQKLGQQHSSHQDTGQQQPMPCQEGSLCVVNSHFFFHPNASHVRNIHTAAIMAEVKAFLDDTEEAKGEARMCADPVAAQQGVQEQSPAVLFCGDLNSDANAGSSDSLAAQRGAHKQSAAPPTVLFCGDLNCGLNHGTPGVVQLLNTGHLPHDFWDWDTSADFSWGGSDDEEEGAEPAVVESPSISGDTAVQLVSQAETQHASSGAEPQAVVTGVPLATGMNLHSADDLQTPFTNYVRGYAGLLDYIWYEPERLQVVRGIPLPSLQEVEAFMPSQRFPSDHMSVVYDFIWRQQPHSHAPHQPLQLGSSQTDTAQTYDVASSLQQSAPAAIYPIAAMPHNIPKAVTALQEGQVIAVPTDTLYGLAADANSSAGIQHIYSIKQRQAQAPLAICIAEIDHLQRYCVTDHLSQQLLEHLLPGKVTLILQRRAEAPLCAELNPGLSSIGVRIPDSDFIRGVCQQHRGAIALTSANVSGALSPLCINDFQELWPQCAAVFNGLRIQADRAGSTIIDLTVPGHFKIARPGVLYEQVQRIMQEAGLKLTT